MSQSLVASSVAVDFSCPGQDRSEHLKRIISRSVQDLVVGFLRRRGEQVEANSTGLVPLLRDFADTKCDPKIALDAPSWNMDVSLRIADADHVHSAAVFAAHLYHCGIQGKWQATFSKPGRVRFGAVVTPEIIWMSVDGQELQFIDTTGKVNRVTFPLAGSGMRELVAVDTTSRRSITLAEEVDDDLFHCRQEEGFSTADLTSRREELEKAVRLTREYAPEYLSWYGDIIRMLVALPSPGPGLVMSRTVPGQCGVVYVSSSCGSIRLAESLIHEASHQYFFLGSLEMNYCSLADETLYYSSYRQMDRPIDRILVAFHAFGNVLLFYRAVAAQTVDESLYTWAKASATDHERRLKTLAGFIEHSPGVMRAGRLLFQTLADKVRL